MMRFRFWSDTNLDGFVQSIATGVDTDVASSKRIVTVHTDDDRIRDLASQWGGTEQ